MSNPRPLSLPLGGIVRTRYVTRPSSNVGGTLVRWIGADGKQHQKTVTRDQSSNDPARAALVKLWPSLVPTVQEGPDYPTSAARVWKLSEEAGR